MQIVRNETQVKTKRTTEALILQTKVQTIEGATETTESIAHREATPEDAISMLKATRLTAEQLRALTLLTSDKVMDASWRKYTLRDVSFKPFELYPYLYAPK
jgi:hypothetical protein